MCINVASERPKECAKLFMKKKEKINDIKFKNYIKNRNKKIQEEIKDKIIDKYREKIISQSKEIEELKKKLEDIMKASVYILKNSFTNSNIDNINIINNTISHKTEKSKLKNDILNKKDIVVHSIINRNNNNNKNFNSSTTFSNESNRLKKSNTLANGLTVETQINKSEHRLSLSNSRIKLNKNETFYQKCTKIEKIKKNSIKIKNKKKEWDSPYKPTKQAYINDLNTYYLKELNKKDYQKIEEIKIKLQNNTVSESFNGSTSQKKNAYNSNIVYKYYSQNKNKNKNKKSIKKNLVNKSNNYSYGKNNLKKIFNSPKSINTDFSNEYVINKERKTHNISSENNNYLLTSPNFYGKNIIHRNININNNNNKIYINTDNNINNVYLQNVNHFKTQNNFYTNKVLKTDDNKISLI